MIKVNLKDFKKVYKMICKAVHSDKRQGTLSGIHFCCNPNSLTVEALDGFRAHSYTFYGCWNESFDIVVPLFKIPTKLNAEEINISCDNKKLTIDWGNNEPTVLQKIHGKIISFKSIEEEVPKGSFKIGFNSTYLKDALDGFDKDATVKISLDTIVKGQLSYLYIESLSDSNNKRVVLPVRLG